MKRMSEVFELPVSGEEMQDHVAFRTFGDEDDAIAHVINNVDKLADALEESLLQIEYLHEKFKQTGSGNSVLSSGRAALAAYRGEK